MNKIYKHGNHGCGHLKVYNGVTLEECKLACEKILNNNRPTCNAFNYGSEREKCSLKACPIPIPEPNSIPAWKDNRGYYMIGSIYLSFNESQILIISSIMMIKTPKMVHLLLMCLFDISQFLPHLFGWRGHKWLIYFMDTTN